MALRVYAAGMFTYVDDMENLDCRVFNAFGAAFHVGRRAPGKFILRWGKRGQKNPKLAPSVPIVTANATRAEHGTVFVEVSNLRSIEFEIRTNGNDKLIDETVQFIAVVDRKFHTSWHR